MFAMKNGTTMNGEQVLVKDWMQKSVTPTPGYNGYGYYWWLRPESGRYFASGAFGQQIEIDPSQNTVVAIQSYWPVAFNEYYDDYVDGFIAAILDELKGKH
jgi:CubicO group peptidase (beta-lactamase class C family)